MFLINLFRSWRGVTPPCNPFPLDSVGFHLYRFCLRRLKGFSNACASFSHILNGQWIGHFNVAEHVCERRTWETSGDLFCPKLTNMMLHFWESNQKLGQEPFD